MPSRYTKQNELTQLQYEITNEISRDAKPIAEGVFGNNARHPDMASISNAELDAMYRAAYLREDRQFLMQEAQRDPQQFLAVTDRLGVPDPPLDRQGQPTGVDPNALQQALQQPVAAPPMLAEPPPQPGLVPPTPPAPSIPLPPPGVQPVAPPVPTVPLQPQLPGM